MNGINNGWMEGFGVQINLFHALRDSFICTSACKHKQGFDFTKANACTRPLHASFVPCQTSALLTSGSGSAATRGTAVHGEMKTSLVEAEEVQSSCGIYEGYSQGFVSCSQ